MPILQRMLEMEICSLIPQMIMDSLHYVMTTATTKIDPVPELIDSMVQQ